jgi:hypothetical protein
MARESVARHPRGNFGSEASSQRRLVDDHQSASPCDGIENGGAIKRLERGDVDDFGLNTFARKLLCCFENLLHHRAPRHERHVMASSRDDAMLKCETRTVVRHIFMRGTIKPRRFQEHDRIGVADG